MRWNPEVTVAAIVERDGRYLMVNENGWLSLAPTDNERIAHRIDSVLTTV